VPLKQRSAPKLVRNSLTSYALSVASCFGYGPFKALSPPAVLDRNDIPSGCTAHEADLCRPPPAAPRALPARVARFCFGPNTRSPSFSDAPHRPASTAGSVSFVSVPLPQYLYSNRYTEYGDKSPVSAKERRTSPTQTQRKTTMLLDSKIKTLSTLGAALAFSLLADATSARSVKVTRTVDDGFGGSGDAVGTRDLASPLSERPQRSSR